MDQENLAPGIRNLQVSDQGNDHLGEPLADNASLANPPSDQGNASSRHSTFTGYNEPYDEINESGPSKNENTHYPINYGYENVPASSSTSNLNHDANQATTSSNATDFPGYLGHDNHAANQQGAYERYQGASPEQANANQESNPYSGYPGYSGYSTSASGSQAGPSSALNHETGVGSASTSAAVVAPYIGYTPTPNEESGKIYNINVVDYDVDCSEDEDDGEGAMSDDGDDDSGDDEDESLESALSYHEKMADLVDF